MKKKKKQYSETTNNGASLWKLVQGLTAVMRTFSLKGEIVYYLHRCADYLNVLVDGHKGVALGTSLLRMAIIKLSIEG